MITTSTDQIPNLQGLILIDCWEPSQQKQPYINQFYQNIINNTSHYNFVCVVNSGLNILLDLKDESFANLFGHHCNNKISSLPPLAQQRHHQVIANSCRWAGQTWNEENPKNNSSSQLLHDHFFTNDRGIYLLDPLDIVFHNQIILGGRVQNWLIAGRTWQMCVHYNKLGLNNLAALSARYNINFYATDYSFLKDGLQTTAQLKDFECDSLNWMEICNFGYQLVPNPDCGQYSEIIGKYLYA
jgi:hypothetical protein